jgi:adenosylmethionine-8-amino-7-oxononanoate aminotransferase
VAEQGGVFAHGLTYQGHPVAAAVGLANLKLLDEGGIVNTVKSDTGPYLQNALREVFTDHPLVGEIHGAGAVAALQFARSKAEKKRFDQEGRISLFCARSAFDEGLIVRASIGRIIISPALIATRLEIDELVSKLKRAVDRTAKELRML